MTWEYFYDRYDNWSEATLKQRISVLETAGPMDEVCEVADAAGDEETVTGWSGSVSALA